MAAQKSLVMTLMVRDEADVIAAMIEHHLAQGVELLIVTDNASTDGTREILARYAELGVVELHDDPRLEKQQAEVVTAMARRAFTEYGARWVINADADEFWFAAAGGTLAEALATVPDDVQSFNAKVRNLFGTPIESGSVIPTHTWRDERDDAALHAVGLHAHPTQDCVHRGSAGVKVQQGNHGTSMPLADSVPDSAALEVLHLPFRQWPRYQQRVRNTAAAYERSGLTPSPRHHGMRDARWLEAGVLRPMFVARHPGEGRSDGFQQDARLVDSLTQLVADGKALIPELVAEALQPGVPMASIDEDLQLFNILGPWLVLEAEERANLAYREHDFYSVVLQKEHLEAELAVKNDELQQRQDALDAANATVDSLTKYTEELLSNPVVRAAARVAAPRYGWGERFAKARRLTGSAAQRGKRAVAKPAQMLRQALDRGTGEAPSAHEPDAAAQQAAEQENIARAAARAEAFKHYQELWPNPPELEVLYGKPSNDSIPLIMCLWNRPGQIDAILEQLDKQTGLPAPLRLVLWNNNEADENWYRERIQAFAGKGALASVEFVQSPHNIRGIGRFIAARRLWDEGVRGNYFMLDDDELIADDSLGKLWAEGGQHRIASLWAWRVNPDDYWQRERATNGEIADYAATCGCVCDLEVVAEDSFFTELSELGLFIEDA